MLIISVWQIDCRNQQVNSSLLHPLLHLIGQNCSKKGLVHFLLSWAILRQFSFLVHRKHFWHKKPRGNPPVHCFQAFSPNEIVGKVFDLRIPQFRIQWHVLWIPSLTFLLEKQDKIQTRSAGLQLAKTSSWEGSKEKQNRQTGRQLRHVLWEDLVLVFEATFLPPTKKGSRNQFVKYPQTKSNPTGNLSCRLKNPTGLFLETYCCVNQWWKSVKS